MASIFNPRAKNNLFLILAGPQNTGKTEFFRRLLPEPLQRFRAEQRFDDLKSADVASLVTQNILLGDDELDSLQRSDWRKVKAMLDKDRFNVRLPYGRLFVQLTRLASFWGTGNEFQILSDLTGNRRLVPVEVQSIDFQAYNSVDKAELWVEAYHLWKSGFSHELTREEIKLLNIHSERFQTVDEVTETIEQYYELPTSTFSAERLTATQIADYLRQMTGRRISPIAIGHRLTSLGFRQVMAKERNAEGKEARSRHWLIGKKLNS